MRSRAARLTFGAVAWIAIVAAATFLFYSEKRIAVRRAAVRAFDVHAREAADQLADIRAGQQAYVAAGQGVAFWMPKVAATLAGATQTIAGLRQTALSPEAQSALDEAAGTVNEFNAVDTRARDYLKVGPDADGRRRRLHRGRRNGRERRRVRWKRRASPSIRPPTPPRPRCGGRRRSPRAAPPACRRAGHRAARAGRTAAATPTPARTLSLNDAGRRARPRAASCCCAAASRPRRRRRRCLGDQFRRPRGLAGPQGRRAALQRLRPRRGPRTG